MRRGSGLRAGGGHHRRSQKLEAVRTFVSTCCSRVPEAEATALSAVDWELTIPATESRPATVYQVTIRSNVQFPG